MAIEEDFVSLAPSRLCATCEGISLVTYNTESIVPRLPHHETLVSFEAAIKEGCYICTRVGEEFSSSRHEEDAYRDAEIVEQNIFSMYNAVLLDGTDPFAAVHITQRGMQTSFVLYPSENYPSRDTLSASTSSRPTRSLLQSWLKTCSEQHSDCNYSSIGDWTPTRVLDLGINSSTWKLCIPAVDSVPVPKYTTMSYCWGDAHFLKLTSDDLETFRSGLPISSLPQAFQDAISITKDLGIRFIWIDALCILQDHRDDFARECTSMSRIYTNSSCNIVATFSKNPHESLFRARNYRALQTGKPVKAWKVHDPDRNVWCRLDTIVRRNILGKEMANCAVSSRGWILQEILLAPRAVYFGVNQVHWICRSLEACEIWPEGVPPQTHTLMDSNARLFSNSNDRREFDDVNRWNGIVERYSTLALSHAEDKLVALSGLVEAFQRRTQDEYFWGHWKSTLPLSLNWYIPFGKKSTDEWRAKFGRLSKSCGRRSSIYRAPSWSWASIEGIVDFEDFWGDQDKIVCSVLELHASTTGPDPNNKNGTGQLTLQAPWNTATVLGGNTLLIPCLSSKTHKRQPRLDSDSIPDGTKVDLALTVIFCRRSVWAMRSGKERYEFSGKKLGINALILLPLEDNPGFHTRVGTLYIECEFQGEVIPRTELAAFGLNMVDEDIQNMFVGEESFLRTFKII